MAKAGVGKPEPPGIHDGEGNLARKLRRAGAGRRHHVRAGIDAGARADQRHKLQELLAATGADVEHATAGPQVAAGHVLVIPGHRITLVADRREIPATEFTGIPRDCP